MIPATSISSEQVSSVAGQILIKKRSVISEGMVNVLLCCKNWLGFHEVAKIQELRIDGDVVSTEA